MVPGIEVRRKYELENSIENAIWLDLNDDRDLAILPKLKGSNIKIVLSFASSALEIFDLKNSKDFEGLLGLFADRFQSTRKRNYLEEILDCCHPKIFNMREQRALVQDDLDTMELETKYECLRGARILRLFYWMRIDGIKLSPEDHEILQDYWMRIMELVNQYLLLPKDSEYLHHNILDFKRERSGFEFMIEFLLNHSKFNLIRLQKLLKCTALRDLGRVNERYIDLDPSKSLNEKELSKLPPNHWWAFAGSRKN